MRVEYREERCRSALNRVRGMPFAWSLNPYTGCAHRCTFCYVRAFELRADRPSDDRYGRSIRVKTNVAEVLARELARPSWRSEGIAIGAATDPYQPAEGRYRLTRACLEALGGRVEPVLADHARAADRARRRRAAGSRTASGGLGRLLRADARRRGLADDRAGHSAAATAAAGAEGLVDAGVKAGVGLAPILPGLSDRPEQLAEVVKAAREAGATSVWANLLYLRPGTREHFLEALARDWPDELERYERLYAGRAYLATDGGRAGARAGARARPRARDPRPPQRRRSHRRRSRFS